MNTLATEIGNFSSDIRYHYLAQNNLLSLHLKVPKNTGEGFTVTSSQVLPLSRQHLQGCALR